MPYETPGYHGLCCSCCCRSIHRDPYLSPAQTNPTAGTPEDAAAQLDMAGDLDRALKAREDEGGA